MSKFDPKAPFASKTLSMEDLGLATGGEDGGNSGNFSFGLGVVETLVGVATGNIDGIVTGLIEIAYGAYEGTDIPQQASDAAGLEAGIMPPPPAEPHDDGPKGPLHSG